ncbi:alpha/beta-hydrolase family protein [Nocardia acidivorans]|uniref:alpha/beta-hydrolase family protein n=1 Tax=Nocardia acidivorans TaxID=404580 RepID=UPI000A5D6D90|nr:alpha/beta-hydrolase family protein [Nocardia acidivorans]
MSIIDRPRPTQVKAHAGTAEGPRPRWSIGAPPRFGAPRIGTTLGVLSGVLASLAPGVLPRTPTAQAILTALLILLGLAVVSLGRIAVRRRGFGDGTLRKRWRVPALVLAVPAAAIAVAQAEHWQNRLRSAMGVAQVDPAYWSLWAVWTALITGAVLGLCAGIRWVVRRLGRLRSAMLLAVFGVVTQAVLVPAVVDWRRESYAAANAYVDPTLEQPVSPGRSGSPVSAASWSSLGAQGRKFVAGRPAQGVRVYIGLNSAPDLNARVALAIRELDRSGGFQRENLVVTVPTGSGWIDGEAASGLARRFDGDVALVGLQYSNAPSWATFVFGRSAAEESARALFTAVEQRISTLAHRPKLYVYGQSLGALGGNSIFTDDADQDRRTCAALWAGPPANHVHRAGATVLANASDPVVHWSPSLLWSPPDLTGTRPDAPVPQWLPVVSFLQTSLDLLGALDAPSGHGHRYGIDQGTALGSC